MNPQDFTAWYDKNKQLYGELKDFVQKAIEHILGLKEEPNIFL
jgi:hypothetical protein